MPDYAYYLIIFCTFVFQRYKTLKYDYYRDSWRNRIWKILGKIRSYMIVERDFPFICKKTDSKRYKALCYRIHSVQAISIPGLPVDFCYDIFLAKHKKTMHRNAFSIQFLNGLDNDSGPYTGRFRCCFSIHFTHIVFSKQTGGHCPR